MKILVVDDEKMIVKGLKFSLEQENYEVDAAYDGKEALDLARENKYDIILLDLMLPEMDGCEVCRRIREFSDVPVIMLTAKSDDIDKIMGLEYGADDYITKPFNILEVKARIKAIVRRSRKKTQTDRADDGALQNSGIRIDPESRRVYIDGNDVRLTSKEFDILKLLMENPGKIYDREQLLTLIWGNKNPGDARTVDVNVRRLREKIEKNPAKPEYVRTRWGMGYYFSEEHIR